ncbi:LRR-repeat protein [Phanerochaete sordida]|uniref:LRR-repeat protein n=1 Tax=Phanerochaete sordida TaxID=48140 RepID=A0A9P3G1N6_9APHY|nr:LRR-repeat protein [Phanerochaete sordida]
MSSSRGQSKSSGSRGGRARRFGGDPQHEDEEVPTAQNQTSAPSSTSWSTRRLPVSVTGILPLAAFCMRAFAQGFRKLSSHEASIEGLKAWLLEVPDAFIPRLFYTMKDCGVFPSNDFIAAYLLRGPSISLDGENMPDVSKNTVTAIARRAVVRDHLQELHLRNLGKIQDTAFAAVVEKLPALRVLDLGGCNKVGAKVTEAVAASCPALLTLNVNHTSVQPVQVAPVLKACKSLQVLKVAGISSWTEANVAKLWSALDVKNAPDSEPLRIRTLKLKMTPITDQVLNTFLELCPEIRRLDVSFTGIRRPAALLRTTTLEKLSLTSTAVTSADLLKAGAGMVELRALSLGALGRTGGSSIAVANTSAMTMTDDTLKKLTNIMMSCKFLRSISLAGNTKLGTVTGLSLTGFVRHVGRKCEVLNLSGVTSLRSSHLEGLLADDLDAPESPLRVLNLNNTGVDDAAAPYISTCKSLETLEVGGTRFTSDGLFDILDGCPVLQRLDLTSCRGVPIAQRRSFFEAYYEARA